MLVINITLRSILQVMDEPAQQLQLEAIEPYLSSRFFTVQLWQDLHGRGLLYRRFRRRTGLGRLHCCLGFTASGIQNELTFFVEMTLLGATMRVGEGLLPTAVQRHQQVGTLVAVGDRNLLTFEQLQILLVLGHGSRRMMMMTSTHDFCDV